MILFPSLDNIHLHVIYQKTYKHYKYASCQTYELYM